MKKVTTWRTSMQAWLALLALGMTLWLLVTYFSLILEIGWIVFGAYLLSLIIRPIADWLAQRRIPRSITVLLVYLVMGALLSAIVALLAPMLSAEIDTIRATGPTLLQQASSRLSTLPFTQWIPSVGVLMQNAFQGADTLFLSAAEGVGNLMLDLLVLIVLGYFFSIDSGAGYQLIHHWLPPEQQPHVQDVWRKIVSRLTRWVWAQAGVAIYFAVIYGTGLMLLGVPFALSIGVVGGVLEIVPYLGGTLAVLLATFSALTVNVWLALWVVLFYAVVTLIESHVIAPIFYGRAVGVRSSVILLALVIGAKAQGVIGVFFAVPVAVILSALAQELQERVKERNVNELSHKESTD